MIIDRVWNKYVNILCKHTSNKYVNILYKRTSNLSNHHIFKILREGKDKKWRIN